MKTQDIRRRFLEYFKKMGHEAISSSPVVPHNDPTLLFTNAGMNQFKDVFLAKSIREYTKAVTCQKCIRVGGKHNDLENVGHTKRHLTFFEMLGNFSFGDYFKEQAIEMAWQVSTEIFGFEKDKIYPSIFRDDEESFALWQKYVPAHKISRFGEKDNFWTMGDTGPCGPCSELYYDKGSEFGSATNPLEDTEGERFLEFWNLVFMQFNRTLGKQELLPKPSIDTGAGLERVMSLIQKKESVYQTDILGSLITAIEEKAKIHYDYHDTKLAPAFHVIADHLRCLSFAIADGVQPSNVDRGYVLRKVLRRAVRYGKMLGFEAPFLASILPTLITTMGADYKELVTAENRIAEILTLEEESFFRTLKRGGNILNQIIEAAALQKHIITGADAFKLKDTYGLPFEEILLIAKDSNLHVDSDAFQKLEMEAKEKSKVAKKVTSQVVEESLYKTIQETQGDCSFVRKEREDHTSTICCLIKEGALVDTLEAGTTGILIMKETPFYAEMGGQVGDTGYFVNEAGKFTVTNCISPYKGIICHIGSVDEGNLRLGDSITAKVDWKRREKIENNHTATHLLHFALHEILGAHTRQAGSVVDADRLRFDFSHHKSVSAEEIKAIEQLINEKIRLNTPTTTYEILYEEAQKKEDIKQFFGEKYGRVVRVVDINYSKELCGGTHTSRTGNIGYFRITKEGSIAAGVRRIEAVTGSEAEAFAYSHEAELHTIAELLKTPQQKVYERIEKLHDELKTAHNEIKMLKKAHIDQLLIKLLPLQTSKKGLLFIAVDVPVSADELKILADEISLKNPSSVIALGCKSGGKGHLFVKVSADIILQGLSASDLLKKALAVMDGNGGGKADIAQGAGKSPDKMELALQAIKDLI